MASVERVLVGLVGLGAIAQSVYLPILTKRRDLFEVVAVCDRSFDLLRRVADRFGLDGAGRYQRVEDLLCDRRVEAVMVLTSGSHGAMVAEALDHRLAVFCEKPLAYTRAEADTLLELSPSAPFQLGYMKLYDPAVIRARELIARRSALRVVDVSVLHPPLPPQLAHARVISGADQPSERDELEYYIETALGPVAQPLRQLYEILLGSLVHDLSLIRFLVSDPRHIVHVDVWPDGPAPQSVAVDGVLDDEVRLTIRWHYLERYPAYREELNLHYDDGSVRVLFPSPFMLHVPTELRIIKASDGDLRTECWRSTKEAFEEQLIAFWRLIREGMRPSAGLIEGRTDILTAQRIVRQLAAQRGLPIAGELRVLA
jgi:predicted dehydrogenase